MTSISYFQTLPECIVQNILQLLVVKHNSSFNQNRLVGLSLLHSCSLWRIVFIKEALSELQIELHSNPNFEFQYLKWPRGIALPSFAINHLVKRISLFYNCWASSRSADYVDLFKASLASDLKFLSAHRLDLTISLNGYDGTSGVFDGLNEVLNHLQITVPNVKRVTIDCDKTDFSDKSDFTLFFQQFLCRIAKKSCDVTVLNFDNFFMHCHNNAVEFATGLTHFTFNCYGQVDDYHQIVQRNASTLKLLIAEYEEQGNVDGVFYNQDVPVIYPRMESLNIFFHSEELASNIKSQSNHFPVLKKLCILTCNRNYMEILFNNRNATYDSYEYIGIHNKAGLFKYALDYYAFSSKSLKNLKTAVFNLGGAIDTEHFTSQEESDDINTRFIALIMDATKELRHITIRGAFNRACFMRLLSLPSRFAKIQEIRTPWALLDFPDLLLLIKSAPYLCSLNAGVKDDCPSVDNVDDAGDLLRYMEDNYKDSGRYIKRLVLSCAGEDNKLLNYCTTLSLLAIACPNIVYLFRRFYKISDARKMFLRISEIDGFSKYSDYFELISKKIGVVDE